MLIKHCVSLFCLTALLLITSGCGSSTASDPRGNHVQGTVTFDGAPVPAGDIQFIPASGNSGPPGSATIVDGKFDTSSEGNQGTVGGPHTVIINGFDGNAKPDDELPLGAPLFADFKVEFDIPKEGIATKDFEVKK